MDHSERTNRDCDTQGVIPAALGFVLLVCIFGYIISMTDDYHTPQTPAPGSVSCWKWSD